jgi:opacity protein-like surface antigen
MMKTLMAGALTFTLWGGAALANEGYDEMDREERRSTEVEINDDTRMGGSWDEGRDAEIEVDRRDDAAVGGAWDEGRDRSAIVIEEERIETERRTPANMRGVQVFVGGGVEGYTGNLAPEINPGVTWGAGVALKPTRVLGLELGYSGAANSVGAQELDNDIVRNGGSAVATIGLTGSPVQPYLLGGIGFDRYNVRGEATERFQDDTIGYVPVGLGLRTHIGSFTADARLTGDGLFNQGFAPQAGATALTDIGDSTPTARYNGMIRLGATF